MTSELSVTLAAEINTAHAACLAADEPIKQAIIDKCNAVRKCGILLQEVKAAVGHGAFGRWIADNLTFSYDTAALYMRFARANVEPIQDLPSGIGCLRDALVASGALSPGERGLENRSSLTWLDHFTGLGMKLMSLVNGQIEKSGGDIQAWPEEQRLAAKKQLQPFVDLYNRF